MRQKLIFAAVPGVKNGYVKAIGMNRKGCSLGALPD